MTWDEIDLNSIIIIVGAICIGIIKIIEMYKSGSYRNTKLNNSKEEMIKIIISKNNTKYSPESIEIFNKISGDIK